MIIKNPKQIKYIEDYDKYRDGILRYEGHIRDDARKQIEAELLPQIQQIEKDLQTEREKAKQAKLDLQAERRKTIYLLRELGMTDTQISEKNRLSG